MTTSANFDSTEDVEYQELPDSVPSCKRNYRQRDSDHMSFKKQGTSNFKSRAMPSERSINFSTDTNAPSSNKYMSDFSSGANISSQVTPFDRCINFSTETNAPSSNKYMSDFSSAAKYSSKVIPSDGSINFSTETNAPTSSKYMSEFSFPLDFSVQKMASEKKRNIELGKTRCKSSKHEKSDSIFSSDSNLVQISSDENTDLSLKIDVPISNKHSKSVSMFSSDPFVQVISSDSKRYSSLEKDLPPSNEHSQSVSMFSSDPSIIEISSDSKRYSSLEKDLPPSNEHSQSVSIVSSNPSIIEISSDEIINPSLKKRGQTSSMFNMDDFSLPSQFHVALASSNRQDQISGNISMGEEREMRKFVHSYDWNKDLKDQALNIKFPNYAPESKMGMENFTSPMRGWNRVLQKYSPSTEIFHSPIKPIEANIRPNVTNDELIWAQVWIVGMSEQFYYDNSITLIHKYHEISADLNHALVINSRFMNTDEIIDTFVDVVVLGSGTFGDVFRVKKAGTREYMAVKFLKKIPSENSMFYQHTHALMEYLMERNSLIKARNSPFVVQFIHSIKFPGISGLFLFFEWCLCDLRKYINLFVNDGSFINAVAGMWDGFIGGIENLGLMIYSDLSEHVLTVTLIYIFEVFCALDFLAKCNIVHQDLKPENVMIATNFHLKIADFGITYNTRFITGHSQIYLVDKSDINLIQSSNYKPVWGGTPYYEDMELCYRKLRREDGALADLIINNKDHIDVELSTDDKEADPDFMSDLWACGVIGTELIFGGVHLFSPENIPNSSAMELASSWSFAHNVLALTYIKRIYARYIEKGFINYGGPDYEDLMKFLATIFKPRQERATDFVKEKVVYRYKNKVRLRHIDIRRVEEISVFADMGLTSNNVFLYSMPVELDVLLHKPLRSKYTRFRHLLESIPKYDQNDFMNLKPGIQSNYF